MTHPIVIVGGGFAGFWAAMAARRYAGDAVPIQLVSREPVLQMRPRLYEAAPQTLGFDMLPLLARTDIGFVAGEAEDVAPGALLLASGARLPFSRMVVATGSMLRPPPVPGVEHAFSCDTQADAIAFDRRLAALAALPRPPRIAIIGGGFTGIELALELRDRLAAHGCAHSETATITVIDGAAETGHELGPNPRPVIEAALREARVEMRLSTRATAIAADGVSLSDGTTLAADAVALATGMVAAPFAARIPGTRDTLGRVEVDAYLRAPAAPHVFVTGDAAAADTGDGHIALQSCQHALRMGRFAGANAAHDLRGEAMQPYVQHRYVTCLDLGRSGAVRTTGWDRQVVFTGAEGKRVKRGINTEVIYPPAAATREDLLSQAEPELL